jgi:hypothetical protein
MATDEKGKVDQGKIKAEAENLAKPDAQTKPISTEKPADEAVPLATGPVLDPKQTGKVEHLSEGEAESRVHDQLTKEFGAGYVKAQKGGQETTFTARAWDLLGANKEGWKPVVKTPPEVKNLREKKASETK